MEIIISNSSDKPIYEQIAMQIKSLIMNGTLSAGEALPSMRALAKDLHISVITVQRAYEDLTRDGFIETVSGKGSFVASPNKEFIQEEQLRIAEELLEKVAIIGRTHGLRGKGGGYRLTRPAEEYNVYEILKLTEGSMAPVSCLEDTARECERRGMCATLPVWEGLEKVVREYLSGITIQELTKQWQPGDNYVI